ncbi:putative toxin-antitoxin system toxin component, PIN family [Pseudanabaenaceae cyanobacterium LEGE 13415]|nr:putative toxin-antitoxin system toxin component, PIN family [Pseudanabaenaceae cyanobacterium LEGE 13415]
MSNDRFVLDTNLLISAALFKRSIARQAFDVVISTGIVLLSEPVLTELRDVFSRSRFDRYLSLESRNQFLDEFLSIVEMIEISESIVACRDPKDDKFLELASNGNANYLLSSDQDLLVLNPFRAVKILTPADFLVLQL